MITVEAEAATNQQNSNSFIKGDLRVVDCFKCRLCNGGVKYNQVSIDNLWLRGEAGNRIVGIFLDLIPNWGEFAGHGYAQYSFVGVMFATDAP